MFVSTHTRRFCLFSFFFYGYHRYLHSFPTRRSSDLRPRRPFGEAVGEDEAVVAEPERTGGDRKSTRLNSSHEWISYAVFCLKKKKPRSGHVPAPVEYCAQHHHGDPGGTTTAPWLAL